MYASKDDLISRFGMDTLENLAIHDEDTVSLDTALDAALNDAGNEIDSYLRAKYQLPIVTTSTSLKRCAIDLAFYNLHENQVTELVEKRHDDWIKWLQNVAAGKVLLDVVVEPPADGSGVPVINGGLVEFKHTRPGIFGELY